MITPLGATLGTSENLNNYHETGVLKNNNLHKVVHIQKLKISRQNYEAEIYNTCGIKMNGRD